MIRASVAAIISDYEVAFDKGSDHGVALGQVVTINRQIPIPDPAGGEALGSIERPTIRFKVTEVKPKFCVGQTYDVVTEDGDDTTGIAALSRMLSGRRKKVTRVEYEEDFRTVYVATGMDAVIEGSRSEDETAESAP